MDDTGNPYLNKAAGQVEAIGLPPTRSAAGDEERLERLTQLRDLYVEAQELAVRGQPHENLDWILGWRRDLTQDPLAFHSKRIELISLWLEDLVAELESPPPALEATESENRSMPAHQSRYVAARKLREATKLFLKLFRSPQ
ncbi:MAG TPA: hypothetical protein VJA66_13585 [Thermoanaerobaculia bacterium]